MKTSTQLHSGSWMASTVRAAVATITIAAMTLLASGLARAGGTVTNCTEASLRAAMAGGGTVTFACDGTIFLSGSLTIDNHHVFDARGHQVTLNGCNTNRVFFISAPGSLTLVHLTVSNGRTHDGTNGYWNGGSYVDGGPGEPGGGIYNAGNLVLADSVVCSNLTGNGGRGQYSGVPGVYSGGGAGGVGGGIYNLGTLLASNSVIAGNATGAGGISGGGLTYYLVGGSGGAGGGLYNQGAAVFLNSTICSNTTGGGANNPLQGPGAKGGGGGGICSAGVLVANNCTFRGNSTGPGGSGGPGDLGGSGGAGGAGAALFHTGIAALTNCTFAGNATGSGGAGGSSYIGFPGGPGPAGAGAGIYCSNSLTLVNCTVATNRTGGGITVADGSARLLNSLVALNGGYPPDVSGAFQTLGHNLIGATNGSSGFPGPGDLVGSTAFPMDLKFAWLADNGGPTLTLALLPGSPAIDAGSAVGAPATDQREVPRPQGPGVDIGAFEYQYLPVFTGAKFQNATNFWLQFSGLLPAQVFKLQTSSNLLDWFELTNFAAGGAGVYEFLDGNASRGATRFYRLKASAP